MHNYANQYTIKLQLSPRDAVLQYERRLRERGRAGISASAVFKITPFRHIHLSESRCAAAMVNVSQLCKSWTLCLCKDEGVGLM